MSGYHDPPSGDACRKLQALAATLIEADEHGQLEPISPIEYEMTWWRVYDQIEPDHSGPHRAHWWERTGNGGLHRRLRRPSSPRNGEAYSWPMGMARSHSKPFAKRAPGGAACVGDLSWARN